MTQRSKPKKTGNKKPIKYLLILILGLIFLFGIFNLYYANRIFPKVYVQGLNLSGKSESEASMLIESEFDSPRNIPLRGGGDDFEMDLVELGFEYDAQETALQAFLLYRTGTFGQSIGERIKSFYQKRNVSLAIKIDETKLQEFIDVVAAKIDIPPIYPSIIYANGEIVVNSGRSGKTIDKTSFKDLVKTNLTSYNFSVIEIPITITQTEISETQKENLSNRAKNLVGKSLTVLHENEEFWINDIKLLSLIKPEPGLELSAVSLFIETELAPKINREPQDAVFKEQSGKAVEFLPGKKGVTVNLPDLSTKILGELKNLEKSDQKNLTATALSQLKDPKVTTEQVNNMGIKELLGTGKSNFKGSIPGRVHNVNHASQILNGVLIPPGEIASFNKILGDISQLTGYKQAYIIKDGKTILGDGGGVCQTSTTLFRAVLSAGLPVIERRSHAYRVGYYEQGFPPGLDATVFSPTTDFKFKNDTPGHILIQTMIDLKNLSLSYEIYGTSDGRIASVSTPVITSQIAPPEDLYIDEPNLPLGKVEQTEHRAWGAKVIFDYKVERHGETIYERTFVSNYRPWGNVYLRGTKTI